MFKRLKIQMEIGEKWQEPEVRVRTADEAVGKQIIGRLENYPADDLIIKVKDQFIRLDKTDVYYLEVFNKIVTLYTANEEYSFRKSLVALKEELPSEQFLQVSKSALVNTREIRKLEVAFSGSLYAYLKNDMKITVSRRFVDQLKQNLGITK